MRSNLVEGGQSAENTINTLDRQLSEDYERSGAEEIFLDPRMKAEFDRHEKMLEFLQCHPALTKEQKRKFRE
jgi:hypothetical protein